MRQRVIFAILVALTATACQKKASGQTVAVVNNEEITAAELNDALSADPTQVDTKEARAAVLQKLVDRKLLVQQARSDGLDKSPEFINQQRRTTDDLLITMLVTKRLKASQLPTVEQINKFEAAHPGVFGGRELWTLQQIIYPLPKNAAVTAKLGAAKTLDEVAQVLTASGIQFTRASRKVDTAIFPQGIYSQVAGLPAGEPFIAPGSEKAVASVIEKREPAPLTGDQARNIALTGIRNEAANKVIQDRVKSLRATAKIEYQPGFAPPAKK